MTGIKDQDTNAHCFLLRRELMDIFDNQSDKIKELMDAMLDDLELDLKHHNNSKIVGTEIVYTHEKAFYADSLFPPPPPSGSCHILWRSRRLSVHPGPTEAAVRRRHSPGAWEDEVPWFLASTTMRMQRPGDEQGRAAQVRNGNFQQVLCPNHDRSLQVGEIRPLQIIPPEGQEGQLRGDTKPRHGRAVCRLVDLQGILSPIFSLRSVCLRQGIVFCSPKTCLCLPNDHLTRSPQGKPYDPESPAFVDCGMTFASAASDASLHGRIVIASSPEKNPSKYDRGEYSAPVLDVSSDASC